VKNQPVVLGIETSCDETGIAIVRGLDLLADVTASSMDAHARFGGIVPEVASRAHLEAFSPTLQECLAQAGLTLDEVDAIAVTAGPGLIGSLTVGAAAAKALAIATGKPLYGVNHILGHVAVDSLVHGPFPSEFLGLVVSGGHSSLMLVRDIATDVRELGQTLDDAAGEAFDKVGRLLGLPYPGGPHIDRLSQGGDRAAFNFPRGLSKGKEVAKYPYDFSFSGLKTAVARVVESYEDSGEELPAADLAASFSEAVVEVIVVKTLRAARDHGVDMVVIGGGFSANSRLRELAAEQLEPEGITVRIPPIKYCTDNGAMIAALGSHVVSAGLTPSDLDITVTSQMALDQVLASA